MSALYRPENTVVECIFIKYYDDLNSICMCPSSICNICGYETESVITIPYKELIGMSKSYNMTINYCKHCGFIYTINPFSESTLSNRYSNYSKFEYDEADCFSKDSEGYEDKSIRQHDFICRVLKTDSITSVLEIGAASGFNLSLYKGIKSYGIEPSPTNCRNAKKNYDVDLFCGTFSDYIKNNGGESQFDLVIMSHVLEHIVDPGTFMNICSKICSKYFYIEVPTFDIKVSDEPYGMFCEEHVNMFVYKSLQYLMNVNGFQLVDVEYYFSHHLRLPAGYPSMGTLWVKKRHPHIVQLVNDPKVQLDEYLKFSKQLLQYIQTVIDSIDKNKKVAIWGTGHHLSMLLGNTNLSSLNIVKIYDSDIKKKGVELLNCKIQPFDREDIFNNEIDTIIVATYVAQNSIMRVLTPYENDVEVITFYDRNGDEDND